MGGGGGAITHTHMRVCVCVCVCVQSVTQHNLISKLYFKKFAFSYACGHTFMTL